MDSKNKANRTAYMTGAVRQMLKERLPQNPNELIFKDRDHGGKIKFVSKAFDRTVKRLGLNDGVTDSRHRVVFHTLRHTFASWLALDGNLGGNSILTIKELLGHKTLAMTERYSHLMPDLKKQAVLALEANFNESRNKKVIPIEAAQEFTP